MIDLTLDNISTVVLHCVYQVCVCVGVGVKCVCARVLCGLGLGHQTSVCGEITCGCVAVYYVCAPG